MRALYYPQSPYEFTMVSADILGSVYERFLGKVITLTGGHRAKIEEKPEVRKAGGVYYTPVYIVDYIVKNTVGKLLEGKTPKEAAKIKVLDPACGSGSFLIGAYQFLLDWYLKQYLAAEPAALAAAKNPVVRPNTVGGFSLTIAERKRILLDHIHGVDLDGQAVEVTKLNLLLKCLEGETSQTLGFESRLFRERALPDLGKNILCGNSLIGTDIMLTDAWKEMSDEEKAKVNPFGYERAFPGVFKSRTDGGFDAVIGNPPYIRLQTIIETSPASADHFKETFESAASGNYDIYVLFVEQGLELLRDSGRLGYIIPNKFMSAEYGAPLRKHLGDRGAIDKLVNFGHQQIFAEATTYTCLLFLTGSRAPSFETVTVADLESWRSAPEANAGRLDAAASTAEVWSFEVGPAADLVARLQVDRRNLGQIADLYVGLQTDADDVFILKKLKEEGSKVLCASEHTGAEHWFEKSHLKPFLKGSLNMRRYHLDDLTKLLLFPYETREGRSVLLSPDEYKSRFPLSWGYLGECRERLAARAKGTLGPNWYGYVYKKNHTRFDSPKILAPAIANGACFALDPEGRYYFVGSGGGGGGGYGIRLTEGCGFQDLYILGVLNSSVSTFYLRRTSSIFRGGYIALNRQYIEGIPIPDGSAAEQREVSRLAGSMVELKTRLATETLPQRRDQLEREIEATDRQIDALVYQLYGLTDDEIRIVEAATA